MQIQMFTSLCFHIIYYIQYYIEILEVVDSAKILGLSVSNNFKWNNHIDQIISKARKRLYFLSQLKRARVGKKELVLFFTTCIRPILDC